jgi:hypothetical protein
MACLGPLALDKHLSIHSQCCRDCRQPIAIESPGCTPGPKVDRSPRGCIDLLGRGARSESRVRLQSLRRCRDGLSRRRSHRCSVGSLRLSLVAGNRKARKWHFQAARPASGSQAGILVGSILWFESLCGRLAAQTTYGEMFRTAWQSWPFPSGRAASADSSKVINL